MAKGTRGILTEGDAELLMGEADDISERAKEQRQIRMRTRLRKAIAEFEFIFKNLPAEDREHIFSPPPSSDVSPTNVQRGLEYMAAFAYLGLKQGTSHENAQEHLDVSVEFAKEKLQAEEEVDEVQELLERHKAGEQLTNDEVGKLLQASGMGVIDRTLVSEVLSNSQEE